MLSYLRSLGSMVTIAYRFISVSKLVRTATPLTAPNPQLPRAVQRNPTIQNKDSSVSSIGHQLICSEATASHEGRGEREVINRHRRTAGAPSRKKKYQTRCLHSPDPTSLLKFVRLFVPLRCMPSSLNISDRASKGAQKQNTNASANIHLKCTDSFIVGETKKFCPQKNACTCTTNDEKKYRGVSTNKNTTHPRHASHREATFPRPGVWLSSVQKQKPSLSEDAVLTLHRLFRLKLDTTRVRPAHNGGCRPGRVPHIKATQKTEKIRDQESDSNIQDEHNQHSRHQPST